MLTVHVMKTDEEQRVEIRTLTKAAELMEASLLYRRAFGYGGSEYAVSPRLLAALPDNGGTVLGAFRGMELVGFCYGFTALDGGHPYHYSQATVVAPEAQGLGVGRALKRAQAASARALGVGAMRWAFDPYALRNAHFNLGVLGAVADRFKVDMYSDGSSDRVIALWDLSDSAPSRVGYEQEVFPANASTAAPEPSDRLRLRERLTARIAAGGILVGVVRVSPTRVGYRFERSQ